jgi:RNA polymerase sigma factor (sigma-70 family)
VIEDQTVEIQRLVDRLRDGDAPARDALIAAASARLERLTRKMLGGFPEVKRWEQTDDVLQNALMRLHRALGSVCPESSLHFYRLAAEQIRRELIDLARRYRGAHGLGANHASVGGGESGSMGPASPAGSTLEPGALAEWTEFHDRIATLPEEERQVVDLLFYQGLSQAEAAGLLGVTDRTVKRRWQSARLALFEALGGRLPGI